MACKNCHQLLSDQDKFCNQCGAPVVLERITMNHLFAEFYETLFSWDSNKPIKTFIDLLRKPEDVIDGYIYGTRKKYLAPIGFVVIALTLSSLFFFVSAKFFPNSLDSVFSTSGAEYQMEAGKTVQKWGIEYNSWLYFFLIPILSFISWLVFLNKRKYNYAEHLIFNIYAYSEVTVLTIILYIGTVWHPALFSKMPITILFLQIFYYTYVSKRIFSLTAIQVAIKLIYFIAIVLLVYITAIIALVFVLFATGNAEMFMDPEVWKSLS